MSRIAGHLLRREEIPARVPFSPGGRSSQRLDDLDFDSPVKIAARVFQQVRRA
jgi:hypothetical protein